MRKLLAFVLVFAFVSTAAAQPAHSCGNITYLEVTFDRVDMSGMPFAPRFKEGDVNQFNCIAARDPHFASMRFDASWKAFNYWSGLFGAELGVQFMPLPAPSRNSLLPSRRLLSQHADKVPD